MEPGRKQRVPLSSGRLFAVVDPGYSKNGRQPQKRKIHNFYASRDCVVLRSLLKETKTTSKEEK